MSGSRSPNPNTSNLSTLRNTNNRSRRSQDIPVALRRSFPTLSSRNKRPTKKAKKSNIVHKDVVLLLSSTSRSVPTHQTRCLLENKGFVVHGCPIDKAWDELELKSKVNEWFPVLELNDIDVEFVKSCYGQIVNPKLAEGIKFTAARVLGISGQSSIYIRPKEDIPNDDEDTGSVSFIPDMGFSDVHDTDSLLAQPGCHDTSQERDDIPCSSSSLPSHEKNVKKLKEMFPNTADQVLAHALSVHITVDKAALSLSSESNDVDPIALIDDNDDDILMQAFSFLPEKVDATLNSILKDLEKGLSNEKEKLKVDEEDLFNDAMCYYKDPNFDAKKRLRVIYQGQPAVDTGGVTRQFFTDLLNVINDKFFEGHAYRSPIYNADVIASGMMKYIGTIVVHSILHGGPGFPIFSHSLYDYLTTCDFELTMKTANVEECNNLLFKKFKLRI